MKAVIVLPTYNEKENIKIIIPQIEENFKKIKNHDMNILVVDDNSPDKTADEVKAFQKKYKNIHLLMGEKKGLGVAYLRGFDHAVKVLHAEVIFMMDADLSHPPEMLPDFMKGIDQGYDLVIGSRYIKGGDTPDWTAKRKIISRVGNLFARLVIGMYGIHDCTSGFRAIRVDKYRKIDTKSLSTRGYAFLSTVLYELLRAGSKVKEIPLVFKDRKFGQTKLQSKDMVEFFWNSIRLRIKSMERFIKFGIIGATGTLVNLALLFSLVEITKLDRNLIAPAIALEISIIWNFMLNNFWTFKSSSNKSSVWSKLAKFHVAALTGFVINLVLYNILLHYARLSLVAGKYDYLLAQFIAIVIVLFWNYFLNVKWTWRDEDGEG